ncbi:MAG: intradiol ring-cleavage dioxygenase [Geminicoccaceae bacterium]
MLRLTGLPRRGLLLGSLGLPFLTGRPTLAATTPECRDGDEPTPAQTAGPFFKPGSPLRADFRVDGLPGEPMDLSGIVMSPACAPLAGALVELWHCDSAGIYDNDGYRCRGHQLTDSAGRFAFATILPALYPGRTRHFHVRVQAPGGPLLTTQLYFPDEPGNARDRIWRPELEMAVERTADGTAGRYLFVVAQG